MFKTIDFLSVTKTIKNDTICEKSNSKDMILTILYHRKSKNNNVF